MLRNLGNFNHSNPVMNFDVGICRFFIGCIFETSRFPVCQLPRFTSRKWCGLDSIGPCTSAAWSETWYRFTRYKVRWNEWSRFESSGFNVLHLVPTLCNFLEEKGFVVVSSSVDFPGLKHDFDRSKFLGSVSIFQSKSSKIFQFKVYLKGCAPNLQSLLLKPPTTGANIAWAAKNGLDVGQICQRPGRQNDMEIY